MPIWEDARFSTRPDKVFQAAARNGQIPSVYEIGTEPGRIYYSEANKDVTFPDTVAAYLRRHVCYKHLTQLNGGRYPNGPKEWVLVYRRLHGWEDDRPRGFAPRRGPSSINPWQSRAPRCDDDSRGLSEFSQSSSAGPAAREDRRRQPADPAAREERRRQPHLDDAALAGMSWNDLFSLVSSTPRDKHRRRAMMDVLLLPGPDKTLSATDQTRQSRTLWALGALVDRLATAQREVVAELLRLEPDEVGTAIRYMSPPNFAKALGIPVHELLDHLQPELLGHLQPTSDESPRPLKMFIRWFHLKRWMSAWQIQRCYRQRLGTYVGPPCFDGHIHLRAKRQNAAPETPPTYNPVPLRVLTWSTTGPTSAWSSEARVQPAPEPADEIHAQVPVAEPSVEYCIPAPGTR